MARLALPETRSWTTVASIEQGSTAAGEDDLSPVRVAGEDDVVVENAQHLHVVFLSSLSRIAG